MRGIPVCAGLALAFAVPAAAQDDVAHGDPDWAVIAGVDAFFEALRSDDKTALARTMHPGGTIYIHDRMVPGAPETVVVAVADHLARWAGTPKGLDERMTYATVLVDGDMAQVWGPYRFMIGDSTTHCGINSLSLIRTEDGWKVANTSFTMEPPSECDRLGAPGVSE